MDKPTFSQRYDRAWRLFRKWILFVIASAKLAKADKMRFYQAVALLTAHTTKLPNVCRAYSHCVQTKVGTITNTDTLKAYLKLIQPMRSPSLNIVRVGGIGDGGYCMLAPPPPY